MPSLGFTGYQDIQSTGASHPTEITDLTPLSLSGGSTQLSQPVNGLQLYITGGNSPYLWLTYTSLPAYLTGVGKLCSVWINETNSGTFTTTLPCRAYLLRQDNFNTVSLSGWTSVENSNTYFLGGGAATHVYYQDFAPGTYTYQNNSAMYIWDFTYAYGVAGAGVSRVSAGAGSMGSLSIYGSSDYLNPSYSSLSNQRGAIDPFNQGNISYSVVSGALPTGMSLNASTGVVSGSYTNQGINTDGTVYSFTIRATAANGVDFTDRAYSISTTIPFPYRQIITRNYMAGGYQNSSLWSNVNRTTHSNDTSTNLGDGALPGTYHYKSGSCGDTYGYIFNASSTYKFNMRTESSAGTLGIPQTSNNTGTVINGYRTKSYTCGDGSGTPYSFTFSNETFSNMSGGPGNDSTSGIYGEFIGVFWNNGGGNAKITFSNETWSGAGGTRGAHGQQKGFNGKQGYGYGSDAGTYNGGYTWRKTNMTTTTDSDTGARPNKQLGNQGEDNNGLGQNVGYTIGGYDGTQNNRAGKYTYSTDSGSEINGALSPGGHNGASSGHCFHRD